MIIVPEFIIFDSIKNVLKVIRKDYKDSLFTGITATGTVNLTSGSISSINITNGGTGYPFPPLVKITGVDGSGAEAISKITNGVVTSIEIKNAGTGYTSCSVTFEPDTTKSILYRLLVDNGVQRYKLFEQCVTLLINNDEHSARFLDVNLFFNAKRASIPTMHITLPSEMEKNNSLNNGEGYRDPVYEEANGTYIKIFNRRFGSRYNIIFTSDNTNEVVLMYQFFKSIFISLNGHFNVSGLQNPKLGGGDIQIDPNLVPPGIFTRALSIEFEYDTEGQDLFRTNVNSFVIEGILLTPVVE